MPINQEGNMKPENQNSSNDTDNQPVNSDNQFGPVTPLDTSSIYPTPGLGRIAIDTATTEKPTTFLGIIFHSAKIFIFFIAGFLFSILYTLNSLFVIPTLITMNSIYVAIYQAVCWIVMFIIYRWFNRTACKHIDTKYDYMYIANGIKVSLLVYALLIFSWLSLIFIIPLVYDMIESKPDW